MKTRRALYLATSHEVGLPFRSPKLPDGEREQGMAEAWGFLSSAVSSDGRTLVVTWAIEVLE